MWIYYLKLNEYVLIIKEFLIRNRKKKLALKLILINLIGNILFNFIVNVKLYIFSLGYCI